jgi:tetratricopeptide (TPR) repeat protein
LAAVNGAKHAIEGSMLALRSVALLLRGSWQEARACAELAQQNARIVNSAFNIVTCAFYAAYASWQLTHAREALERMLVTVEWIESHHLELLAGFDYGSVADALRQSGDTARALSYAERALRRASLGDPLGEASAYRVLAQLAAAAGESPAQVEAQLARARLAGERRGSRHEHVKTLLVQAQLLLERGQRADGERIARDCRAAARELGMPWYAERARALSAPGESERAS